MRIIYFDIDTLRADHLGCYGYHRNTSPNIDEIAKVGVRFENCFVSDAPCLPSRSSFFSGRFGIHTGVVNHGGLNADPYPEGKNRPFRNSPEFNSFTTVLKKNGIHTVTVSPFAERHSAWWFYSGFREIYNPGKYGLENADEIFPYALNWLRKNGKLNNWFLHINCWDPHTPYNHPANFGRPFEKDPPPSWITEEIIKEHYESFGPHSAHEPCGYDSNKWKNGWKDIPAEIKSLSDYKKWIDGYDTGIRFADYYVGKTIELLKKLGIFDETIIIISSDHGENQGELNVYGDHQTADYITSRVPFIIKWPGITKPRVDNGLHYQTDIGATILETLGFEVPRRWDGISFANSFKKNKSYSRDYLVISQCAWSCQRSVIFKDYLLIKTYHTGLKNFPEIMLFNIKKDPHEIKNIAKENPEIVKECLKLLNKWHKDMMESSTTHIDPLDTVLKEGGPYHTRGFLESYCKRLIETNRSHYAKLLKKYKGKPIKEEII
jgi:arylsulfatase A-like enzyme